MSLKQPGKLRVNYDDLDHREYDSDGFFVEYFNGRKFTGYAVLDYYPDNHVASEMEYKNGSHLGWDNEYYENGTIKEESLMFGETTLEYYEYDATGNKTGGKQVSDEMYQRLVSTYNLLI